MENKNDYFDKLALGFAHEVKNPVSLIRANIELISLDDTDGRYTQNYRVIRRQLDKINSVVTDFIELSKSTGQSKEKIFICDLIDDILDEYDISVRNKNIKFSVKCTNENINVRGDYSKLCILFFNILKNAVESIEESGNIDCMIEKRGSRVFVSVKDDGSGISENIKDRIGKPFVTTKKGGSGLGLVICRNIAESHNGSFEIRNNQNKGCTVSVMLPI